MAWLVAGAIWNCTREVEMKWLAEKTVMVLAILWFMVAASVAAALWLLAVPFRLWGPVVEKAHDWCQSRI